MKKLVFLSIFALATLQLLAQSSSVWHPISEQSVQLKQYMKRSIRPTAFATFELDFETLQQTLRSAPMEMTEAARTNTLLIDLPMPNGTMETFKVVNSPIAEPEYMALNPQLAAYAGKSVNHSSWSLRMVTTPSGFDAVITNDEGQVYIESLASDQRKYYQVYYTKDLDLSKIALSGPIKCGVSHVEKGEDIVHEAQHFNARSGMADFVTMRKYRLAAATTGEFAALHGGTKPKIKDHLFKVLNKVNEVLGKEVAIRVSLIAKNDTLIFTDKNKDPYPTGNSGGSMVGTNTQTLSNLVGNNNFDFGHVFTGGCTDVGGVASGVICTQSGKGNGVSCDQSADAILLAVTITAHEMGHQMTASHTMSDCQGVAPAQLSSSSKIEPGSGTTIMSYDGGCGDQNLTGTYWKPLGYFHAGSLNQIINYTRTNVGNTCAEKITSVDNHIPSITTKYTDGFYIPISTPFQLEGQGADVDNDELLYNWDQFDIGVQTKLGVPNGNSAIFRSYPPSKTGNIRVFPLMSTVVTGLATKGEMLPTFDRKLTFRLLARDVKTEGGLSWSELKFKATGEAGPFLVGFPNNTKDTLTANKYTEIKWDVANTNGTLVNCQKVNISISTDGGYTYPTILLANTDNDGSEYVLIPNITSAKARVRVMAADNVFFDISDKDVQIVQATRPAYSVNLNIDNKQVCLPGASFINIKTTALAGFAKDVTLEIVGGLPNKTQATFAKNPIAAGEETKLNLDFSKTDTTGFFNIKIRATSDGVITERLVPIKVVANDFSSMAMTQPVNGKTGVGTLPSFAWNGSFNASRYEIQLASSPSFEPASIIFSNDKLINTSYIPAATILENKTFYWRIRGFNDCGASPYTEAFAFHTVVLKCETYESTVEKNISGSGTPTVVSTIPIPIDGTVNDVNVIMQGNHEEFNSLIVKLISPKGTDITLLKNACLPSSYNFNITFDDQAPLDTVPCPPTLTTIKPFLPLDKLENEDLKGDWKLSIFDDTPQGGGKLKIWKLRACGNVIVKPPVLERNTVLKVAPKTGGFVNDQRILAVDENNTAEQLKFTLVTAPVAGFIKFNDTKVLKVGDTFTQAEITAAKLIYYNTNPNAIGDYFYFVVEDGEGGFIGTPKFLIDINVNNPSVVSDKDLVVEGGMKCYPNPTHESVNVQLLQPLEGEAQLQLFNVQGQLVRQQTMSSISAIMELSDLSSGVYLLKLNTTNGAFLQRIVKQ